MSKYNRTIKLMEMLIFRMEKEVKEVAEGIKKEKNEKIKANLEKENSETLSNIENMRDAIKELKNRL